MIRRFPTVLLLALFGLLIAACGPQNPSDEVGSDSDSLESPGAAQKPVEASPTSTVTIVTMDGQNSFVSIVVSPSGPQTGSGASTQDPVPGKTKRSLVPLTCSIRSTTNGGPN